MREVGSHLPNMVGSKRLRTLGEGLVPKPSTKPVRGKSRRLSSLQLAGAMHNLPHPEVRAERASKDALTKRLIFWKRGRTLQLALTHLEMRFGRMVRSRGFPWPSCKMCCSGMDPRVKPEDDEPDKLRLLLVTAGDCHGA